MKINIRVFLLALSSALLAALFILSLLADRAGFDRLMLATPSSGATRGIPHSTVEQLSGEGLQFTYEIPGHTTVYALNSRHTLRLIGTNSLHLDITGYRLVLGSFFTQAAWEGQNRVAVLNESAAFAIFGSTNIEGQAITINGERWIVTGVIDDGREDNPGVYIPSSVGGGYIHSLLVRMPGERGQAAVVNTLSGVGIREGEYDFVDLSRVAGAAGERFSVAWRVAACLALILLAGKWLLFLGRLYLALKQAADRYYLRELVTRHRAEVLKVGGVAVLLLGGLAALLRLLLQILATTLRWQELTLPVWYPTTDFADKLAWLGGYHNAGSLVFAGYLLAAFAVAAIISIRR